MRVWVDVADTGASQPWESLSLSELGIKSIGLATTASGQTVAGNVINETATVTFLDGRTERLKDVSFGDAALQGTTSLDGQGIAGIDFAERVLAQLPARAGGIATAVTSAVSGLMTSAQSADATLVLFLSGPSAPAEQVTIDNPATGQTLQIQAPGAARQAKAAVVEALGVIRTAAQATATAAADQVTSDGDAASADLQDVALGSAADVKAAQTAATTEAAWLTAFTALAAAAAALDTATTTVTASAAVVQQAVLTGGEHCTSITDFGTAAEDLLAGATAFQTLATTAARAGAARRARPGYRRPAGRAARCIQPRPFGRRAGGKP